MSVSGLTNQYTPATLDGLNVVEADQIYIDGKLIDLDNLVPYTGATQALNMGSFPVQSSHVPSAGNDLVNYTTLVASLTNQDVTNDVTYLNKITSTAQTVQASTTFLTGLSVSNERTTNLSSKVVVDANYQNLITSADVSVSQNFGSISSVPPVYQATTNTASGSPILIGFPIVSGKRYRFTIEMLVEDPTYGWYVEFIQSADNINPVTGGIIGVYLIPTSSTAYTASDYTFVALTSGSVIIQTTTDGPPGNDQIVKWKNLTVYEMGVSLENATYPSLGADRVPILNEKHQLVASGINSTKLGYLDNVSSDIQTQLNARVLKAGDTMTGTLDMGANKITTSYTPVNNEDVITKGYGDSAYATTSTLSGYLPLTGGTLSGNLSSTTGTLVNFGEALKTVATDKGYTGASFTVSAAEVPAGVQTGTLSGIYRLTANSGYAVMAMAIADLNATYQFNEYYTFTFTNIAGSVPLTLTVYQNTTPRVALNITTSPQTLTTTFTTGMGSGKIYFNFQALSANPYVDWTGFTMTRTDTIVSGRLGVGTTNPGYSLDVNGVVRLGTTGRGWIHNNGTTQLESYIDNSAGWLGTLTNHPLYFYTVNSGARMTIATSGYVGIGITQPNALLQLDNTVVNRKIVLYDALNNDHQFYGFGINSSTLRYQSAAYHIFYAGTSSTTSRELFRLNNDGNVVVSNGGLYIDAPNGRDFITISNANYTTGEYSNIRFNHANTRNSYVQSYLPGGNYTDLKFYVSDVGGSVSPRMTVQGNGITRLDPPSGQDALYWYNPSTGNWLGGLGFSTTVNSGWFGLSTAGSNTVQIRASGTSRFNGGSIEYLGTPLTSRIHKVIPVIEVNGNWNGVVRAYQFRLEVQCEVRFHGYCTYYASSVGYGNAYLRLYNYDTGQLWYLSMGKYFNINYNHETLGVERYELLPVGWYQVYVYPDYNCNIDSNDQIYVSGIAYQ